MNLRQLAAHLQLSPTTVSRALNGFPEVNAETRERVVEAARQLGYRANTVARRLATGKTDSIGIIYPFEPSDLGDPVFLDIIAGITERLGEASMDLMIVSAAQEHELDTYKRMVSAGRVDGLIVARTQVQDPRLEYLQEKGFPFVAHGRSALADPYPWFDYDNEYGMRLAVERLTTLGHQRIGLVSAPLSMNFAAQRRMGYLLGLNAAGVAVDPDYMVHGGLTPVDGAAATRKLLALPQRPTALVVDNNVSALGVISALRQAGLLPGHDISIIVFGGLPALLPDSATVSAIMQPQARQAGRTLAELMLARLAGEPTPSLNRLWKPELVPGGTDLPPPRT
ncbi:substrate-binding domain-containing protein [Amantichitinum ursilacus]|uniref:HTH-type transcriptional regulator RafR n=1 Tax=Amantichitinum ursilacus TaxID=857265 RepID=A0A0N0XKA7_9NEIS|nr:substrate-binding domain-containing protein [Amantichitinum ursilacus]KPC52113.1 HTH-type transcriptional regulator RafR [Amantichitinum ursilacus]